MPAEREAFPTGTGESPSGGHSASEGSAQGRELIVIAKPEAELRVTRESVASLAEADVSGLADLLDSEGITMWPLFGTSEERIQQKTAALAAETDAEVPNLSLYYRVEAPDQRLEELAARMREQEVVAAAYVKPPAELASHLNTMVPKETEPAAVTPSFVDRQGYLRPAPDGIDAEYAWTLPGGAGANIRIIDIEGAWRFTHEDLLANQGGVVGGVPPTDLDNRNHGTAVIGVMGGDRNDFGITGICPDANVSGLSVFTNAGDQNTAAAIRQAADRLRHGDIILIPWHRPGPQFNFQQQDDWLGYIAVEWWPDDYDAIRYAVSRGLTVVEGAGNGAENLDGAIYDKNPAAPNGPFPEWWHNPFRRNPSDSGAILVGAGAPPAFTHGTYYGPDRSRRADSNWGRQSMRRAGEMR
jgi:hypothetical protein